VIFRSDAFTDARDERLRRSIKCLGQIQAVMVVDLHLKTAERGILAAEQPMIICDK
jgi:hypothetical protein